MSEIPEDALKAAEQFIPKWALAEGDFDPWRNSIARAIMAERNRAANLASKVGYDFGEAAVGAQIAAAIRRIPETEKT